MLVIFHLPSVLWRCWLGSRKGIRPVKPEWWYAGMVMCLGQGTDLHMAQQMPLPLTISCSMKSRLVLPSCCQLIRVVPDKSHEGHKMVVCVCKTVVCIQLFWQKKPLGINDTSFHRPVCIYSSCDSTNGIKALNSKTNWFSDRKAIGFILSWSIEAVMSVSVSLKTVIRNNKYHKIYAK